MNSVLRTTWILVLTLFINASCQDGFNDQNILRVQQATNEGQIETNTVYNLHTDANSQISSLSARYQMPDDANSFEFNRERGKNRKVYRIKNPFQNQQDESQMDSNSSQDSDTSASNQYAGVQYSLPPEEFLQQMRAENQYHQQPLSTQASVYSYTATPQPQYLYSTMTATNYDNQQNQNAQEPKSLNYYNPNTNTYQYNNANIYNHADTPASTPAPTYVSTANNQYIGTPANNYVSSSSPMYITNPPNLQPSYVSSPYSNAQTGTVDYSGRNTGNAQNYDNNIYNKKIQVDHYGNSGNAIRYQVNVQNQYQNYPSSTAAPVSSPYSEDSRENWQNNGANYNNGFAVQKPLQDLTPQYSTNPHYRQSNSQEDYKQDSIYDSVNQDSQRYNSVSSNNNNVYYNYIQPHSQVNNAKTHTRETDQQMGQSAAYSHGDYGWKLDRKPMFGSEITTAGYSGYQANNAKSDNEAMSQVSFHMDTSRPYNYNQISKSSSEKLEADEFVRAATKAHENYKQQLEANRISIGQYNNNAFANPEPINPYYSTNDKIRNKYENVNTNNYLASNSQIDYASASPYFARENFIESKPKPQFDHDKAIKNVVPLDMSNVAQNSNVQLKSSIGFDGNEKYSMVSHNKDQVEQNLKQYSRPTSETYYKDKNNVYAFSVKSQPEEYVSLADRLKQLELLGQQGKSTETTLSFGFSGNKRYTDDSPQSNNYLAHSPLSQDSQQGNIQQNMLQRNPSASDIVHLLKLNDMPLRLTQHLNPEALRIPSNNYEQVNIPNPLPVRLNQNLEQHHVDVTSEILNKLLSNKQNSNKQELDIQNSNVVSNIHGFKVANPFNMDLKLVADMLKGKPVIDESQFGSIQNQYNKPLPIKLDLPQIQQLLKNENIGNGLGSYASFPSSYFDIYSNGRYPYQGVKHSRSEEEAENIPIAESSNSHPIGAVVDEILGHENTDITEDDTDTIHIDEDRPLKMYNPNHRTMRERYRHLLGRHLYQKKYPNTLADQPHPVLKPPYRSRGKGPHHLDKSNKRRRINKPKPRFFKTEPLFEANAEIDDSKPAVSTLLKPPPVMEDKVDVVDQEELVEDSA
ncbi:unnamed protein product [Leptosia nina]|uniref:Uncharacterized protein n=1 Tax=Leptosia nina TaxID=320188 RepID=A0AAV1J1N7_9NEOP